MKIPNTKSQGQIIREYFFAALIVLTCFFVMMPAASFSFFVWDDVNLYRARPAELDLWFGSAGLGYFTSIYMTIIDWDLDTPRYLSPIFLIAIHMMATAIIFIFSLKSGKLTVEEAAFIAIICGVAPLNFTKPMTTPFVYNISFMLFPLGLLLLYFWMCRQNIILRISSLTVIAASLLVSSFLPLAVIAIPIMLIVVPNIEKKKNTRYFDISEALRSIRSHLDFLALPFLVYFVRLEFLPTTGLYVNYNQIDMAQIIAFPKELVRWVADFVLSFGHLLADVWIFASWWAVVSTFCFLLVFFLVVGRQESPVRDLWTKIGHFSVSVILVVSAVAAYILVKKQPIYTDWLHRHQLVLQLVSGYFIWASVSLFLPRRWIGSSLSLCAAFAGTVTFYTYLGMHRDAHLQVALDESLRHFLSENDGTTFAFEDPLNELRIMDRNLRIYEILGISKTDHHSNIAIFQISDVHNVNPNELKKAIKRVCAFVKPAHGQYGLSKWNPEPDVSLLVVEFADRFEDYQLAWTLNMTVLRYLNYARYIEKIVSVGDVKMVGSQTVDNALCG